MSSLPTPLRAALGVALTAVDTARETAQTLPGKAIGLPVALASSAVQLSLRAQQQYAAYVVKGDELIGAFRGAPEEPPTWATFDDDAIPVPDGPTPARNTAFDRVLDVDDDDLDDLDDLAQGLAQDLTADLDAALDAVEATPAPAPVDEVVPAAGARTTGPREPAAARKTAKTAAKKAGTKTAARKGAATKATAKTTAEKTAAARKTARKTAAKKTSPTVTADVTPPAEPVSAAPADTALLRTNLEGEPLTESP